MPDENTQAVEVAVTPPVETKEQGAPLPKLGDVVFYVLRDGPSAGQTRPAIVTHAYEDGKVDLTVSYRGTKDTTYITPYGPILHEFVDAAPYSAEPVPGTYHL